MVHASTSAAGVRFLSSIKEGRGLKRSAREAGVHQEVGYRWLRERYLTYRRDGVPAADVDGLLGFSSARSVVWETEVDHSERHHLRVNVDIEKVFWTAYESGSALTSAASTAGVGRSTAYRWLERRFDELRTSGMSRRRTQRLLRLSDLVTGQAEQRREAQIQTRRREALSGRREGLRSSRQFADVAARPARSEAKQRRAARDDAYWQLMRSGETNANASRLLGMHRRTGTNIRRAQQHQTRPPARPAVSSGRYLDLRERLQVADLLRLGCSMRRIAEELGRYPSTIKRELDRHRDPAGRYLPRSADHTAHLQRARPRPTRLAANVPLRQLVQRKLNRCWSPDEISGWLTKTYTADPSMRVCPETIYRELLLRDPASLHKKYSLKLRTGRRIRKSRWLTRTGHGATVTNKTMIDQRPASADSKLQAGHWEGDLIVGVGNASAMVTLRERTTQYGIIINLPLDHTADSVNAAVANAFADLPAHMKRTLTWDQGVEMAKHQDLTKTSGIPIYFAERCSPWQRGANENYNGLARQYFPKGTNLAVHSAAHVGHVTAELNDRPRKGLGYDTPAVRFAAESARPPMLR